MRNLCAVLLSAALVATTAFAASADGVLPPGKPAGVKQAQAGTTVALIAGGIGLVGMLAAMISGGGNGGVGANNNPNGQLNNGLGPATTTTST
jgi:hypothetical protein